MSSAVASPTGSPYDALAFAYDALTADYDHQRWLERLLELAAAFGLGGRRLLDVACGTGKSFLPLADAGWQVTGCDLSQAMLDVAASKRTGARLVRADMRRLPTFGRFDLVLCLDDALNHLTDEQDLRAALTGMRRNLRPGGLAIWDLNTLAMYRGAFAASWACERDNLFIAWRGLTSPDLQPGGLASVDIDVFAPDASRWDRTTTTHAQRHWPSPTVHAAMTAAGLRPLALRGQSRGAHLHDELDELDEPRRCTSQPPLLMTTARRSR